MKMKICAGYTRDNLKTLCKNYCGVYNRKHHCWCCRSPKHKGDHVALGCHSGIILKRWKQ